MTLEGEYYSAILTRKRYFKLVAILMTLEGEYYRLIRRTFGFPYKSRNPHDIGRRILRGHSASLFSCRAVAILMTLEGEYYGRQIPAFIKQNSRNPHDIGRRILHDNLRHYVEKLNGSQSS